MRYNVSSLRLRAANGGRVSIALVLSYAFDWLILLATAAVAAVLAIISPNRRPFALNNSQISYPFVENEKIPTFLLAILCFAAPAVIIFAIAILLVPGPTVPKSTPKSLVWRRKLWEWHTGWLGLALALASSFIITQGMKNLFGKPRPDLLARCQPDIANRKDHMLGGGRSFADNVNDAFVLYSATICQQPDSAVLDEGFRSFPSGHSSFSAAGLIYLSLFIASKLAITIPFLPSNPDDATRFSAFPSRAAKESRANSGPTRSASNDSLEDAGTDLKIVAARNQAAAPPVYLLVFAIIPWFASIYISATRFSDFRHHGFDILFGYLIGLVCAVFAFRYYHLPISQGAGWSWGPRSKDRSFWAGVGVGNYVGPRNAKSIGDGHDTREPRARRNSTSMTEVDLEPGHPYGRPADHDDNIELLSMSSRRPERQPADLTDPHTR